MSRSLDEQFKRAMKAKSRKRTEKSFVRLIGEKPPVRLTQAFCDELDRISDDLDAGRTKTIPLEVVLREDLIQKD